LTGAVIIIAILGSGVWILFPEGRIPSFQGTQANLRILANLGSELDDGPKFSLSAAVDAGPAGAWLAGMYWNQRQDHLKRDSIWSILFHMTPRYIPMAQVVAPADTSLAKVALAAQHADARAHFWLGFLLLGSDSLRAERLLRGCVRLDPRHGLGWRYLGDALRFRDPRGAIQAYAQSCANGDPGANGCYLAATAEEALGNYDAAIRYYRTSRWRDARRRADSLERVVTMRTTRQ
jgi:hypothetical protein